MKVAAAPGQGVPGVRIANKAETAEFFSVSLPTIEGWIRRGCPVIQRGSRGVSWTLDLLAVAMWRYVPEQEDQSLDPENLPPKERKDWYDGEKRRREIQERDRELIPVEEFDQVYSHMIKLVAAGLETLPDLLERDAGLTGEQLEPVFRTIDGLRESLFQSLTDREPADAA